MAGTMPTCTSDGSSSKVEPKVYRFDHKYDNAFRPAGLVPFGLKGFLGFSVYVSHFSFGMAAGLPRFCRFSLVFLSSPRLASETGCQRGSHVSGRQLDSRLQFLVEDLLQAPLYLLGAHVQLLTGLALGLLARGVVKGITHARGRSSGDVLLEPSMSRTTKAEGPIHNQTHTW